MKKVETPGGLAGRWGELALDAAREDILVADLRAQIADLEEERDQLQFDLDEAQSLRRACWKNLREAREKNRQLWDKLSAREVGSV